MDGLSLLSGNPNALNFSVNPAGTLTLPQLQTDVANGGLSINGYSPSSGGGVLGASTTAGGNTGGSSIIAGVNDPATLAAYDQAIGNTNSAIGRLPSQLSSGNSSIDSSYQNAINQLLLGKNQASQTYDTNKNQTAQNYVAGKNTVGANAGASLNGLLRLLGSRGAGGSSAATISAPGAVAREATLQRNDLGTTFGQNNQALDTNWGDYLTGYNNQVSSAGNQRDQQKTSLQSQVDTNRASLLQTLAQLTGERTAATGGNGTSAAQPYLDQANTLLNNAAKVTTSPINYQTQAYTPPSLASYLVNPNAAPTVQGQTPSNDYTSPYLAALLGKSKQTTGTGAG